jgi:tRNA G18 (ribose-2'-O)-methylase SpoU
VTGRPHDPLDDYRALNEPATRRRVERQGRYFVVEGLFALEALLESPYPIRSVVATERKAERVARLVVGRAPLVVRPDHEVAAVAGFDVHRGVLASADRLPLPDPAEVLAGAGLALVVEGVGDHENLGALFRNAAAFGVGAVLLDPTTADPLYRRSVRVSVGQVLRVPWTRLTPWPAALRDLVADRWEVLALTPAADAEPLARVTSGEISPAGRGARRPDPGALTTPHAPVAVLVGGEGPGLTSDALAAASRRVRIPIASGVDSLNVATAAAIALHAVATSG